LPEFSVEISSGATNFNAIVENKQMTSITFPDELTIISGSFSECTGLKSITFPKKLTAIQGGGFIFSGCSGLTSISFSNRLVFIDESAFYNCTNLKEITITAAKPPQLKLTL